MLLMQSWLASDKPDPSAEYEYGYASEEEV